MKAVQQKKEFDYKWVIVGLCGLMIFVCLGFCSSPRSLFISPITKALDLPRSVFSLSDICRYLSTAVVNIFFATLMIRFGSKKLICAGVFTLVLSSLTYAYADNAFTLCVAGALLGIGLSWTTTTMVGSVVNRWCPEKSGTIMGAVLATNGIGAALATQILSPVINRSGDAFAYRDAYLIVSCILAAVFVLMVIFFKNNPKEKPQEKPKSGKTKYKSGWIGVEFSKTVKKPYFGITCACIFLSGMVLQGIYGIAAAYLEDVGLGAAHIAHVLSVGSLVLSCTKFSTGFIYDKFGLRATSTMCLVASVVVTVVLLLVSSSSFGIIMAFAYAVCVAMALPLETVMLPIYAKDLFGDRDFNRFLGIFVSCNTLGYALGGLVFNLCYDTFGSYKPALVSCMGIMAVVLILMQYVINTVSKIKKSVQLEGERNV